MKIRTFKVERVPVEEFDIPTPTEPTYYFETGVRRSIRIIPIYTTWQKEQHGKEEEVWKLDITCVYNCWETKIEKFSIQLSEFESLWNSRDDNNNRKFKSMLELFVFNGGNVRTKEQFDTDLKAVIDKINEIK
jgi:hypothetical protein